MMYHLSHPGLEIESLRCHCWRDGDVSRNALASLVQKRIQ